MTEKIYKISKYQLYAIMGIMFLLGGLYGVLISMFFNL